jgi:hypothetical protein
VASWKGTFSHLAEGDPSKLSAGGLANPVLPAHIRDGLHDIPRVADPARRHATRWRLLAAEILRWGDRLQVVRYEDLVSKPEAGKRQLLGALAGIADRTAAVFQPSPARMTRRQTLDEADSRVVSSACTGVARSFGYGCTRRPLEFHAADADSPDGRGR